MVEFQRQFQKGEKDVSLELMEFLKDWLVNHIKKTDKQYSPFLLSKGVVRSVLLWDLLIVGADPPSCFFIVKDC